MTDATELCNDTQRLIKEDKKWTSSNRRKYFYSVCCCFVYFLLGWMFQMLGPALVELQFLTGVTFTLASTYITSFNMAHVVGSIEMGFLYGKLNPYIFVVINLCITIVCTAITPFCSSYTAMFIVYFCDGTSTGALDTVALAEISALWGSGKESPMHALHFAMAFGTVLSPIVVNPFLRNFEKNESYVGNPNLTNISTASVTDENVTFAKDDNSSVFLPIYYMDVSSQPFRLYIAYLITAGLAAITLLPFLVMLFRYIVGKFEISYFHEHLVPKKQFGGKRMFLILLLVGLVSSLQTSIEESISDFLPSFCTKHMKWTSQSGALVVSVYRGAFAIGRLSGILFAIFHCSPIKLALIHSCILTASFVGIIISGLYSLDYGIWVGSVLAGLGLSVLAPCMLNVIEEHFFPITGKIATYFIATACMSYALIAPLIGYLMDNVSEMFLGYILLFESTAYVILVLIGKFIIHTNQKQGFVDESSMENLNRCETK